MSEPKQEIEPESITAARLLELLARDYGLTGTLKPCRRGFFGKTWQFEPTALPLASGSGQHTLSPKLRRSRARGSLGQARGSRNGCLSKW